MSKYLELISPFLAAQQVNRASVVLEEMLEFSLKENLEGFDALFVFHIRSERVLDEIIAWKKKHHEGFIFLVESHPGFLKTALKALEEKDVYYRVFASLEDYLTEDFLLTWTWKCALMRVKVLCGEQEKNKSFFQFKERIEDLVQGVFLTASEVKDFKLEISRNTLENFHAIEEFYHLADLKDSFKGLPAIVCGAGASLNRAFNDLRKLKKNALIFAGGSALKILSDQNIPIDFAANLDPYAPYVRFKEHTFFNCYYFCMSRCDPKVLNLFHGPKVLAIEEENAIEKYLLKEMNLQSPSLKYGWNVGNFQCFLAAYLGCSEVFLLGMDMAYQKGQEYAKGIVDEQSKNHESIESFSQGEQAGLFSRRDLWMGKKHFEEIAQMFPETFFYQPVDRLVDLEGFLELSIEDFEKKISSDHLSGQVHQKLQETKVYSVDSKKVEVFMSKLLLDIKETLESLKSGMQKLLELQDNLDLSKTMIEKAITLEELQIEFSLSHELILEPLWEIWQHLLYRDGQEFWKTKRGVISKYLFFERVLKQYNALLEKVKESGRI